MQTAFVFLRVELLRGRLTRDAYRERAEALWDALAEDERARPVLGAADRDKVVLAEEAGA